MNTFVVAQSLLEKLTQTVYLDRVLKIDDTRQPRPYPAAAPMSRMAAADAAPTPIEAGLVEVHAQVTLTVGIK